jgi:PIN domain nuclease of toxin-antitoxin system
MRVLIDTHMALWVATKSERLPKAAKNLMEDWRNILFFSTVSIWEIAIKSNLDRGDFQYDAEGVRKELLKYGFEEITLEGRHAVSIRNLPNLHGDPFDRILIAQAAAENMHLLTADETIARYPGDIIFAK